MERCLAAWHCRLRPFASTRREAVERRDADAGAGGDILIKIGALRPIEADHLVVEVGDRHAHAAGATLARLHLAAADFVLPARPPAVLMNSCQVITAADPLEAASRLVTARPALAAYLAARHWRQDFDEVLTPLIALPLSRWIPDLQFVAGPLSAWAIFGPL